MKKAGQAVLKPLFTPAIPPISVLVASILTNLGQIKVFNRASIVITGSIISSLIPPIWLRPPAKARVLETHPFSAVENLKTVITGKAAGANSNPRSRFSLIQTDFLTSSTKRRIRFHYYARPSLPTAEKAKPTTLMTKSEMTSPL